jgi:hypothetical protein
MADQDGTQQGGGESGSAAGDAAVGGQSDQSVGRGLAGAGDSMSDDELRQAIAAEVHAIVYNPAQLVDRLVKITEIYARQFRLEQSHQSNRL